MGLSTSTARRVKVDDPNSTYADFYSVGRSQLCDSLRFFYTRYDVNNHLLTYSQFEDIFWRFYDTPDRQRKAFSMLASKDEQGTAVVSILEVYSVSYILSCARTRVSFTDKLDWMMAFFQCQSPLEHWDDGSDLLKFPLRPTNKVRKDDVSLFLETTCIALCRLSAQDLMDPLVTGNIVDSIFSDGESNKSWLEVKEQLMCNGEVINFLLGFDEILNWIDLTRDVEKQYAGLERRFINAEQIQRVRVADQLAEQGRLEKEANKSSGKDSKDDAKPLPPSGSRRSANIVPPRKGSHVTGINRKVSTERNLGVKHVEYQAGLLANQCVDMMVDTMSSSSSNIQPLSAAEIDVLRYILNVVSDNGWVSKHTFETAAASLVAFSLLDQLHHRNKLYEGSIIQLRELSSRKYMDVASRSVFFNRHFDMTSVDEYEYYSAPTTLVNSPHTNQERELDQLLNTSCDTRANEIFIRSLDLQLPTDSHCPRKGKETFCGRECFYVCRMGWVEFQCGVFERCGVERALLKTFQRLDNESRGAIGAEHIEALVRDRLGSEVASQLQQRLSLSSQEIVNENIRHICKAFASLTADELHGESTWDNIQAHIRTLDGELHGLRSYIDNLEACDTKFPALNL